MTTRPFIPIVHGGSLEMIYTYLGSIIENVFHVTGTADLTLTDLQAIRAVADNWHNTVGKAQMTAGCVLSRIRTKALDTNVGAVEDYSIPGGGRAGTGGGGVNLPGNATFCVKQSTGFAGRTKRGRTYWPGLNATFTTGGNDVTTTFSGNVVSALNTLRTSLATAGYTQVVVSYRLDKVWREVAQTTPIINAVAVDNHIDSMRRRLTGRGQ